MAKIIKQVLVFAAGYPVISVALAALALLGFVVYAALTFKPIDSTSFNAFTGLCLVVVLAAWAIVNTALGFWRGK